MPHYQHIKTALLAFALLLLNYNISTAQTAIANDLRHRISDAKESPEKIKLLFELGDHITYVNPDSAILLFDQVIALAKQLEDESYQVTALRKIGGVYNVKGDLETALTFFRRSLEAAKKLKDESGEAMALGSMASIYGRQGDVEKEIAIYSSVAETFKRLKKKFSEGDAYYRLSFAYRNIGKLEESLENAEKAEKVLLQLDESPRVLGILSDTYMSIAGYYGYTGDFPKTTEYLLKARGLLEQIEDYSGLSNTLAMLGQVQMIQENDEKAIEYYLESIAMERKLPNQVYLHNTYRALAELYENLQQPDNAIKYYRLSVEFAREKKQNFFLAVAGSRLPFLYQQKKMPDSALYFYNSVLPEVEANADVHTRGYAWQNLGYYNFAKKNYKLAEEQLLKAYHYGEQYALSLQLDVSDYLYKIYGETGDYKAALKYLEINKTIGDSLFNEKQIREVTQLEADFEHDKEIFQKQSEIALLTAKEEVANLRLSLWIGGLMALVVAVILIYNRRVKKKEQTARELEEIGQFKEAMTSMIAHDLKNPLSMVLNSSSENNQTRMAAGQMLQLVNNMLDVHKFESVTVELSKSEFGIFSLFNEIRMQIDHLLNARNLKLELRVDPHETIYADKEVIERVLVNLLTNAIKYAPLNSTIKVNADVANEQLSISVSDSGRGIAVDDIHKIFDSFGQSNAKKSGGVASTGLGLTFCKLALEAHNSEIRVNSKVGEGTTFSFALDRGAILEEPVEAIMEIHNKPFVLSAAEEEQLSDQLSQLKKMKLYEVGEIRKTLSKMRKQMSSDTSGIDRWIDSVMNAAYEGNDSEYEQLLDRVVA